MSDIEFLAKALSYHTKGKDADFLKESAKDYNKDGKIDDHEKDHDKEEDRFEKIEKDVSKLKKEEAEQVDEISRVDYKKHGETFADLRKQAQAKVDKEVGEKKKEQTEVEEVKTYDSGWHDPKPERKDQYGNTIKDKNAAKNLAKQGMAAAKKEKEQQNEEAEGKTFKSKEVSKKADGSSKEVHYAQYDKSKDQVSEELVDDFIDFMVMMEEFAEIFEQEELSIDEAIEEWFSEDEYVEENFGKMSKTKRLIAAKKAAVTKSRTGNWGGGRPKGPKKPKSIQPVRRIRVARRRA